MKKQILIGTLSLVMAAAMIGCGKDAPKTDNTTQEATTKALSPEEMYPATIMPENIHPGSLNSDEDTSERWYPNGDTSADKCFTLTQTSNRDDSVGLSLCLYKVIESGELGDMCDVVLRDGGNGHAITPEFTFMADKTQKFEFDLTFQDNFTCYDFKTNTVWKRCHPDYGCKDQKWYDDAFSGLVAYRDLSSGKYQQIVMNEDHTFVESVTDMDDMTGRWEVQASNVLMLIYDNAEDGIQSIDGGGLLEDAGESAKETTYSANWQQEFNISADGKVTEFGLFPTYDDDMNLKGYDSAFELTTKENLEAIEKEKKEKAEKSKSGGSPYPVPEVENIMDINFDGVNMEQDPDYVFTAVDWAKRDEISRDLRDGKYDGYVFEIKGKFKGSSVNVPSEDGEHNFTFPVWRVGNFEKPATDSTVTIKGVLWHSGNNYYVFYDEAHIKVEE